MKLMTTKTAALCLLAAAAMPLSGAIAQQQMPGMNDPNIDVYGTPPANLEGLEEGPDVEGIISAREEAKLMIMTVGGTTTPVFVSAATEIKGSGGFLGLNKQEISASELMNGLPVEIETVRWGNGLIASEIKFKNDDLETAAMIRGGTAQQFAQQSEKIEALRGRVADIDKYNIKGTTNVYFDTGKWNLSTGSEVELCQAAAEAEAMDNALLLVVGYTDSDGSQEFNQVLSEKRAGRVVNFLQQECKWQPWRMLTPTGMAEADPLADNTTAAGKAQNRRVAVNILVSKSVDGM